MNALVRTPVYKNSHVWLQENSVLLKKVYLGLAALLTTCYPFLALLPEPPAKVLKQYGLTHSSYYLVIFPIVVLLVLIFLAGFYGSLTIKKYSSAIRDSHDGRAMNLISNGLLVLALSLPVTSVVATISGLIERNHLSMMPALTIFNNYLGLVFMGLSFMLITIGAEWLYEIVRAKISPWPQKVWVLAFIIFSTLYTYFIVFQATQPGAAQKIYYLPHWLLLISIVIPYLYIWYRGANAGYCIYEYRQNVPGKLYKSALNLLAGGIGLVIISSIASRTITTLSTKLTSLHLTPLLIIIYALLALMGGGFLLIALGARRLIKIEEV
jgi:magnesium-transporting ATPase (P-type)